MSYDISVTTGDTAISLNWLRNPFGLCNFAEANVGTSYRALWHACNDHSYDAVADLDRPSFLSVVSSYWDRIKDLEDARFHFNFRSYVQLAAQHPDAMLMRRTAGLPHFGDCWAINGLIDEVIAIPVERFKGERHFAWYDGRLGPGTGTVLDHYKAWFKSLLAVAEAMQDPDAIVVISN